MAFILDVAAWLKDLVVWCRNQLRFSRDAKDLARRHNFSMSAIAKTFSTTPGVLGVLRTRFGYIIKTSNRGVIELHGAGDILFEMKLNPQNPSPITAHPWQHP